MQPKSNLKCTAFSETRRIAHGSVIDVAAKVKKYLEQNRKASILIFDDETSSQLEIDFRGSVETVEKRLKSLLQDAESPTDKPAGPGRPKLGVVSREISLLPRHWDWLALQPGGASSTLRKLIDEARKQNQDVDRARASQDATYKFMTVMAGDLPHFEEALRALYAKNKSLFETLVSAWPKDVRDHALKLSREAFPPQG